MRDRAAELYDEEAALAEALAATWGARPARRRRRRRRGAVPRLYLPFDRLLARTAAAGALAAAGGRRAPRRRRSPCGASSRWPATATRLARQVRRWSRRVLGHAVRRGRGRGRPAGRRAGRRGRRRPGGRRRRRRAPRGSGWWWPRSSAASSCPRPRWRCWPRPTSPGGGAPHRPARPRARPTDGFFDDLAPGSYVVHRQHGVARYAGMTTRTVGGRDARLPAPRVPGRRPALPAVDQIDAVTPYSGGEAPTLSKMGGAEWQRTRARARAAAGEIAEELVELYRRRLAVTGHAFAPDTPWQHELESAFPFTETPDQLRADRRREGGHGAAAARWTGWSAATSASARPRWRCGPSSRRSRTASRRPCSCPPPCWPASTSRPSPTATPASRSGSSC